MTSFFFGTHIPSEHSALVNGIFAIFTERVNTINGPKDFVTKALGQREKAKVGQYKIKCITKT